MEGKIHFYKKKPQTVRSEIYERQKAMKILTYELLLHILKQEKFKIISPVWLG